MSLGRWSAYPQLIQAGAESVNAGLNVVVTGHPASGLRVAAEEMSAELSSNRRVVPIVGVKAWQGVAFSGFSAARRKEPAGYETVSQPAAGVLRAAADDLIRMAGPTGVLVVRNPEWLDAATSGAVVQAAGQGTPVVVIVDALSVAARKVALLDGLPPGGLLAIPPLSFDQVLRLARTHLEGTIEVETVARIHSESGGLYGIAEAIIEIGQRSGALAFTDGAWRAVREFGNAAIGSHIKHMLSGLTPAQNALMQAVAAAGVTGEDFTPAPDRMDDLAILVEAGLILEEAGRLTAFPPILEEYMRHNQPIYLRGQFARFAASTQPLGVSAAPHWIATPARALDTGGLAAELDAAWGQRVRTANRARAHELRGTWESTRKSSDALPLVVALQTSGSDREEIEEIVTGTQPGTEDTDYLILRVWWAIYLGLTLGDTRTAFAELAQNRKQNPAFAPLLTAAEQHLQITTGGPIPDPAAIDDDTATDYGLGRAVAVDATLYSGHTRDALALAQNHTGVRPVFDAQLNISANVAHMLEGRVKEGLSRAAAALRAAQVSQNLGLVQAHAYTVMLGMFLTGRLVEARSFLDRILAASISRPLHEPYQLGLIDLGVLIEVLGSDTRAARRLADIASSMPEGSGPLPGMDAFTTRTVLASADIPDPWAEARLRLERGHLVSAAFLTVVAHRHRPDPSFARQLEARTSESQSPLLRAVGRYVAADTDGNADELIRLAEDFQEMGAGLLFVAARGRAAGWYFHGDQKAAALALAAQTWEASDALGPARCGLLDPLSRRIGLTEREVEVVLTGASGVSNREIAETLRLSLRTIESHIYSAYQKIGTSNRMEVASACATWLRPAHPADTEHRGA